MSLRITGDSKFLSGKYMNFKNSPPITFMYDEHKVHEKSRCAHIAGNFRGAQFSWFSQISGYPWNKYDCTVYNGNDRMRPRKLNQKFWRLAIRENWTPWEFPVIRYFYNPVSHAGADYSMLPPLTSQDNNFAQDLDEYTYDNPNQDEVCILLLP
jgi:hypothetical protein